jgi:hypothetical protein
VHRDNVTRHHRPGHYPLYVTSTRVATCEESTKLVVLLRFGA